MIYGLYLSATGVLTSSHRQDVIANNLANAQTVGFKRDLPLFHNRLTEAQERRLSPSRSNRLLEPVGGGHLFAPTALDHALGEIEATGNPLDLAIQGEGFFAVKKGVDSFLTRDGRFLVNRDGYLVRGEGGEAVLDYQGNPITLDRNARVSVNEDGSISQKGEVVARLGVFHAQDKTVLTKKGHTLLSHPNPLGLPQSDAPVRGGFVENANVDPAEELRALMEAQRQLEANANMIRFQDQTLSRLVNDVGKIG